MGQFMKKYCRPIVAALHAGSALCCAAIEEGPPWPEPVQEITYVSSADKSSQPALFYAPQGAEPVPLLVALHTWSGDYKQRNAPYGQWCIEKNWAMIHPHFRGPSTTPEATGSDKAVKDIISAVDYAKANANIDPSRIYLAGGSGGGYHALLLAGRAPQIWAGVSAWVPITDLKAWYYQCKDAGRKYAQNIVDSCGGVPGESLAVDFEYKSRSPLTYLQNAVNVPLDINAGITDGHTGSVPISHSLRAFNFIAAEKDRISEKDIEYFVEQAKVPPHLCQEISDASYGKKQPLFRRSSGATRVTIFDGGHEIVYEAALMWLAKQQRKPVTDESEQASAKSIGADAAKDHDE